MASNKALNDSLRSDYLAKVKESFEQLGEEVLVTGSGEVCMPCVDSEGNDKWVQIIVKIPIGSRLDGEAFDGYSAAEDWKMKQEEKKAKAEEAARQKAVKIARDKANREAKRLAKEKAMAEKAKEKEA